MTQPMTFTYGELGWRSVQVKFDRIKWNPDKISRENKLTFLQDRYGWVTGEVTINQSKKIEAQVKQYFKNCEFRGTLPISNGSYTPPLGTKTRAKRKAYNSVFTINLMVIFDTLEDDIQFAFLLNSGAIKID